MTQKHLNQMNSIHQWRLLIPYSDNPNAPNQIAAKNGLSNIFRLLAPTIKNINAPCPDGLTPLKHDSKTGHTVIEELLIQILSKNDSISRRNIVQEDADVIMKKKILMLKLMKMTCAYVGVWLLS